jgi:hypothetical protein
MHMGVDRDISIQVTGVHARLYLARAAAAQGANHHQEEALSAPVHASSRMQRAAKSMPQTS